MIYHFSLSAVAIAVGLGYVVFHLWAALQPSQFLALAKTFPRHPVAGKILMGLATIWIVWLCATMDLGDFSTMRHFITLFFGVLGVMSFWLLTDFLAVRGLAVLLLLAANILLDGAFLNDHPLKLVVPALAYVWVVIGITLICSPYLLRDWIDWLAREKNRVVLLAWPGAVFGLGLLMLGMMVF